MFAYSMFVNLYFGVLGYMYSRDTREWWDLTQEEKDELLDKYLPESEEYDDREGEYPEGWFELEDWEKKAILDKNIDDYYKYEAGQELDSSKHEECEEYQGGGRCIIV